MFNLMSGEVQVGDTISAETVELKTSKKGIDYHRLKKVKIVGAGGSTSGSSQLDYEPSTNTRWALRLAFDSVVKVSGEAPDSTAQWIMIEKIAKRLLGLFDSLKSDSKTENPSDGEIERQDDHIEDIMNEEAPDFLKTDKD